jgi:hypothetical protein
MKAGKGGGIFAALGKPPAEEDDEDDFADDLMPAADEDDDEATEPGLGGPFQSYADTVFDDAATPEDKADALYQAILTVFEERGSGGGGALGGLGGL